MTKSRPLKVPPPLPIGRRGGEKNTSPPEVLDPAHNLAVLLDHWHRLAQTMLDTRVDERQPQNMELAQQIAEMLPTIRAWATRLNPAEINSLFDALWLAGVAADLEADLQYGRKFATGDSVVRGGKDGSEKAHGTHEVRLAEREQWNTRFAELRRHFPSDPKKALLGMIEEKTGVPGRTLRRHIKQR